jgi:hypothetical protein
VLPHDLERQDQVCSVKPNASKCKAPSGGSVCTGVLHELLRRLRRRRLRGAVHADQHPDPDHHADADDHRLTPSITPTVTETPTFPAICQSRRRAAAAAGAGPLHHSTRLAQCGGPGLANPDPAAPFSARVRGRRVGAHRQPRYGCLYTGFLPGLRLPDGAQAKLDVGQRQPPAAECHPRGQRRQRPLDCTKGAGPGRSCVNGAPGFDGPRQRASYDDDCDGISGACALTANCYFGPPSSAGHGIGTAGLHRERVPHRHVRQRAAAARRRRRSATALESRIYVTGNADSPCPRCVSRRAATAASNSRPGLHAGRVGQDVDGLPADAQHLPRLAPRRDARAHHPRVVGDRRVTGSSARLRRSAGAIRNPRTSRGIAEAGVGTGRQHATRSR